MVTVVKVNKWIEVFSVLKATREMSAEPWDVAETTVVHAELIEAALSFQALAVGPA